MGRLRSLLLVLCASCAVEVPSGVFKCVDDAQCPAGMICLLDPGQSVERHCFDEGTRAADAGTAVGLVDGSAWSGGALDAGSGASEAGMVAPDGSSAVPSDAGSPAGPSDAAGPGDVGPSDATFFSDGAPYDAHIDCSAPRPDPLGVSFGRCVLPDGRAGRVVCSAPVEQWTCVDWCGGDDAMAGCSN